MYTTQGEYKIIEHYDLIKELGGKVRAATDQAAVDKIAADKAVADKAAADNKAKCDKCKSLSCNYACYGFSAGSYECKYCKKKNCGC